MQRKYSDIRDKLEKRGITAAEGEFYLKFYELPEEKREAFKNALLLGAIKARNISMVNFVLEQVKASVDYVDPMNRTPIDVALSTYTIDNDTEANILQTLFSMKPRRSASMKNPRKFSQYIKYTNSDSNRKWNRRGKVLSLLEALGRKNYKPIKAEAKEIKAARKRSTPEG